jgi:SAM-dependent methyltransferase
MALLPIEFYDALAKDYHLLFADWEFSIDRQAPIIDALLTARRPGRGAALDCACGIGTQALGLAHLGWRVHATDLSPASVARAAHEAAARDIALTTGVADMRKLGESVRGNFDAVLCCDNSIAHMISDEDLRAAVAGMRERLVPGGVLLVTLRDYDALRADRPVFAAERFHPAPSGRIVVFQVWEWSPDGGLYVANHFLIREGPGGWTTAHRTAQFRALLRKDLERFLREAGLVEIRWHAPAETGYHQPAVTAIRG